MPERQYPAGVVCENQLRVWAISRWRGPTELASCFLSSGYRHLPPDSPSMFELEKYYDGNSGNVIGLFVTFTNRFDAHHLLGQVFWCGCEFIAFTNYNIFTNFYAIFPTPGNMHCLPYIMPEDEQARLASVRGQRRRQAPPTPAAMLHRRMREARAERRAIRQASNGRDENEAGPSSAPTGGLANWVFL
jgi:hypothetical protein